MQRWRIMLGSFRKSAEQLSLGNRGFPQASLQHGTGVEIKKRSSALHLSNFPLLSCYCWYHPSAVLTALLVLLCRKLQMCAKSQTLCGSTRVHAGCISSVRSSGPRPGVLGTCCSTAQHRSMPAQTASCRVACTFTPTPTAD
jgi:hypothetical protein